MRDCVSMTYDSSHLSLAFKIAIRYTQLTYEVAWSQTREHFKKHVTREFSYVHRPCSRSETMLVLLGQAVTILIRSSRERGDYN